MKTAEGGHAPQLLLSRMRVSCREEVLPWGSGSHSENQETETLGAELMDPLCIREKVLTVW